MEIFQKRICIEVKPLDGRLTSKVARHTFATVGSRFYIDPDMLRTLMGHERSDVDTIYKDTYPEKERDKFLNKIINTSNINEVTLFIFKHEKVINNKRIIILIVLYKP